MSTVGKYLRSGGLTMIGNWQPADPHDPEFTTPPLREAMQTFDRLGADAVSVVVHPDWGGSVGDVIAAYANAQEASHHIAIIAKHVTTQREIDAVTGVADCVLFVVGTGQIETLQRLHYLCGYARAKGLGVLLEVHKRHDVSLANMLATNLDEVAGIVCNRRDIETGEMAAVPVRARLADAIGSGETIPIVAASGYDWEDEPHPDFKGIMVGRKALA